MRYRNLLWGGAAMLVGALLGSLIGPQPALGVAKEIIELQNDVSLVLQGQRSMQNTIDQNQGVVKTLLQQSLDSADKVSASMGSLQKSVQDVQANSGSRMETLSTAVQGLSDNLDGINTHIGKLNQQLVDLQSSIQSIDAKLAASNSTGPAATAVGGSATPSSHPPGAPPVPTADVLYSSAYRDITAGHYDLSKNEFRDYVKYYPGTELAANAQFYLGEIDGLKKDYKNAVIQYDKVIQNYPNSFKIPSARVQKGLALLALGQKSAGVRELREAIRSYPDTDEARLARSKLRHMGASASPAAH